MGGGPLAPRPVCFRLPLDSPQGGAHVAPSPCEAALPTCADLPHPQVQLFVYKCPHRGQWVAWSTTGTTDDPVSHPAKTWGPFDTPEDVVRWCAVWMGAQIGRLADA